MFWVRNTKTYLHFHTLIGGPYNYYPIHFQSPVLSGLPATSAQLEDNTQVLNSPAGFYLGSFTCSDIDSLTVSIDPAVDPYEIRPVTPTDPVNKGE